MYSVYSVYSLYSVYSVYSLYSVYSVYSLSTRGHARLDRIRDVFVFSVTVCGLGYISCHTMQPRYVHTFFFSAREKDTPEEPASTEDVLFDMFRNQETDLLPIGMFLSVSNFQGTWIILTHSLPKTRKAAGTVTVLARKSKFYSYQKLQHIRQKFIATKWVREAFFYTFVGSTFSCYAMRKMHTKCKEKRDISLHVKCLTFLPKMNNFTQVLVQPSNTKCG